MLIHLFFRSQLFKRRIALSTGTPQLACEAQPYIRSSLLSISPSEKERSDDRKYVCASQATPQHRTGRTNLVPRVYSLSNMAAAGEKTLAHSRNHVTDLSTESGNLFKMAAKIKSERIWVRDLETGEKQTKWRQRQNSKEAKNMKEYTYKPQEYGRMI